MPTHSYTQGDLVQVSATYENAQTQAATDPTEAVLVYAIDNGTPIEVKYPGSLTKDSTGNYHYVIDTTAQAGVYKYLWAGSGTCQVTGEPQSFNVVPPAIPFTF